MSDVYVENSSDIPYFTVKILETRFLDRYFIFSANTCILPKWASRGAFGGSRRSKIPIFLKFLEITIKTLLRPFSPKIYVFRVYVATKHQFCCQNCPLIEMAQMCIFAINLQSKTRYRRILRAQNTEFRQIIKTHSKTSSKPIFPRRFRF